MHAEIDEIEVTNMDTLTENREVATSKVIWVGMPSILLIGLLSILVYKYHALFSWSAVADGLNQDFCFYLLVGVIAQLVDGTMGMGYGATATSCLLVMGVPPAISSTGVHVAEMFTSGASAISHFKFQNIDKKLVQRLLLPGVLGSAVGAYLLADVIDGTVIKPYIAVYMIVLAVIIMKKAFKKNIQNKETKRLGLLATFGGFMDAVGGGGWGPIVTTTLIGNGGDPRYTIGSVNTAEFAVSFASGVTFLLFGGVHGWQVIAGLILGGVLTAPLAAYLVNKIERKPMMIAVGILIILISLRTLAKIYM
jgi:uncharacterized protein